MNGPELSVLVPATGTDEQAAETARRILDQSNGRDIQVIATTSGKGRTTVPGLEWVRFSGHTTLARLLGGALAKARGEHIAIADGSYGIGEGWVDAVMAALSGPAPVAGGAVDPDGLVTATDWAAYFTDYGRFMSPLPHGEASELPGSNIAFRRCALEHGREFAGEEFWKTYWCRELQKEGYALQAAPEMVVYYRKRFPFGYYMSHRFHSGRCFAGMRRSQLSPAKRLVYFAGSPLLVGVFLYRTLEQVWPRRRHRAELFRALPIMVLAMLAWATGESMGYLLGPGDSCSHL